MFGGALKDENVAIAVLILVGGGSKSILIAVVGLPCCVAVDE